MTSPSISSTRRNTPWAAGCCAPKFMVRLRISATGATRGVCRGCAPQQRRLVAIVVPDDARNQGARINRDRLVDDALQFSVIAHLDVADQRKILAERVADESIVGEQAPQIRMASEQDAVQVKGFALEPVGAGPDLVD